MKTFLNSPLLGVHPLRQVRGLYIVLFTLCGLYELINGLSLVGLVARDKLRWTYGLRDKFLCHDICKYLDTLKWSYGSNGMYYKNSWFAKRLINLVHLYELLVFFRENRKGLDIYNMYLALMGL